MSPERDDPGETGDPPAGPRVTRRQAIGISAGVAAATAVGAYGISRAIGGQGQSADLVLKPGPATVELGPRRARTWTYNGELPGPELRIKQGEAVRIRVENGLPQPTSVHWHGIRLKNAMDGVPGMTQQAIEPGGSFTYAFTPPDAGTYLYHSHSGTQLDRGLYGALVVEPRDERLSYDGEKVLVLDDWLDGVAGTPDRKLAELRHSGMNMGGGGMGGMDMGGGGMGGMDMGGGGMGGANGRPMTEHRRSDGRRATVADLPGLDNALESGRADAGDVRYPLYLINGRPGQDPDRMEVRRGERHRLRVINAAADTIFCFFVEGHTLTVTHADGLAVEHVKTEALVVGMGERYDVTIEATVPGAYRALAVPLGKPGRPGMAIVRYREASESSAPKPAVPVRMPPRTLAYEDLVDAEGHPAVKPERELRLDLDMRGMYTWTMGARPFSESLPLRVARDEVVRIVMRNRTTMPHPMHLHGHFFCEARTGKHGARKDTILVLPRKETAIDVVADNPGTWAFHCHNAYHQAAGMMRAFQVGT